MHKIDHPRRGHTRSHTLTRQLAGDVRVVWAEQQFAKRRQKRGYEGAVESETEDLPLIRVKRQFDDDEELIRPQRRSQREDLEEPPKLPFIFNDELWDHQWYMVNSCSFDC